MDEIARKADDLGSKGIRLRFRLDDGAGKAQLDDLEAKARKLGLKDVTIKVRVDGAGRAVAELEAVRKAGIGDIRPGTIGGGGPAWLGPALLALPAVATLAGVATGAVIGLGGAFVAGAGALAAFGAVAKPVLSDALKAEQQVNTAQNAYQAALSVGKNPAKAYAAEQLAIAKAYADLSPQQVKLSQQLGGMAQAWQDLKAAQTPVVAGALQPWLAGITAGLKNLHLAVTPMAGAVRALGTQFGVLAGSSIFRDFMSWMGGTGAHVTRGIGNAIGDLITGVMILLPKFTPLIKGAADEISKLGDAFVRWSASGRASSEIRGFLQWFRTNGPVVSGLLKNIGGALKTLLPGLAAGGLGELQVISGFFGLIAKLPPGLARPIAEVAGALLLLNKLGVVSVGLKLAGALGGAAGAAGLWGRLLPGVALVGGALVATIVVNTLLGAASHGAGHDPWNRPFGADPASKDPAKQGVSTWAGLGHDIIHVLDEARHRWAGLGHDAATAFDTARHAAATAGHDIAHDFDVARHSVASAFSHVGHDIASKFDSVRHDVAAKFAGAGAWLKGAAHDIASAFDNVRHGIAAKFDGIRHDIAAKFSGAIGWLVQAGKNIIQGLINGIGSMVSGLGGAMGNILGKIRSFLPFSPAKEGPLSGAGSPDLAGAKIAAMLARGMDSGVAGVAASAARLAGAAGITGARGGYGGGDTHVHIHVNGIVAGTETEFARKVQQLMREYKRHGGGAPLGIA